MKEEIERLRKAGYSLLHLHLLLKYNDDSANKPTPEKVKIAIDEFTDALDKLPYASQLKDQPKEGEVVYGLKEIEFHQGDETCLFRHKEAGEKWYADKFLNFHQIDFHSPFNYRCFKPVLLPSSKVFPSEAEMVAKFKEVCDDKNNGLQDVSVKYLQWLNSHTIQPSKSIEVEGLVKWIEKEMDEVSDHTDSCQTSAYNAFVSVKEKIESLSSQTKTNKP